MVTTITNIDNKLYLSGFIEDYSELSKLRITAVVNCCIEQHDNICELTRRNIAYYYLPVADAMAPRRDQIQTFLSICKKVEGKILVHCALGVGRSAFYAVSYLVDIRNQKLEKAIMHLIKMRPYVCFNQTQEDKLLKLYDNEHKKGKK